MQRLISLFGLIAMLAMAFAFSSHRKKISPRTVAGGLAIQFILALFMLKTTVGSKIFDAAQSGVLAILALSDKGAEFVFGESFRQHFFAFSVLPTIIFVASITAVLFYFGIMQCIVEIIAKVMCKIMRVSGAESLAAAAEIFVGQTESPLFIRPYLSTLTDSELLTLMTAGMATIAAGVLAAYVAFGIPAGHLVTASFMGAPAAIVIAKIMIPETAEPVTMGTVKCKYENKAENVFDAACQGAADGVKLAINVAAMLIAFISLIALVNLILGHTGHIFGVSLSLEKLFGWICKPLAFLMGVSWQESTVVGQVIAEKAVINEFYAYIHLGKLQAAGQVSPRTLAIATYALCGFANFSSIAIQIGGTGNLVPERRKDFARLGLRAFLAGNLATFVNACIVGILL